MYFPEVDCGNPPNVDNANISFIGTTIGLLATYTCNEGYVLGSGTFTSTCDTSGKWTPNSMSCVGKF